MNTELIHIENLTYTYPQAQQPALDDVSLRVWSGELLLLAGPSGAGKSTLVRCLNGLVPHFSGGQIRGQIRVGEQDVIRAGPQRLSQLVGFVFQDPESQAVVDSVEAEIAFGLENAALPRAEMRLRVHEVLQLLELVDLRDRPLSSLSGGERQRVAIAAALAFRPQVLVMDEPTSQLDPGAAEELLQAAVRLNETLGLTVILVEHRLERVARYADRLVYMEQGRIVVDEPVRVALGQIPSAQAPPLARLGTALGWQPLPLNTKEALPFTRQFMRIHPAQTAAEAERPPAPHLLARGVHFAYNGHQVLRGVDIQVAPGEAVALLGRNGSGKSTLLKCLVGLLRPAEGDVWLDGRSTRRQSVAEICRQVAYLPQNPDDLLFADSVAEELAITLKNHRLAVDRQPFSPEQLLTELGLSRQAEDYPRDLSVGQRQRVSLGAVMVTAPQLLILDEPTRGLDFQAKRDLVTLWERWLSAGKSLLLVTHDVELVARIAHRVMVLSQGEIIAQGPTSTVLTASSLFMPQIARLFPGQGWLTVEDALAGLQVAGE